MNKIKRKIKERSDDELIRIIREAGDYPDQVVKVVEEVLEERDINIEEIKNNKKQVKKDLFGQSESESKDKYKVLRFLAGTIKVTTILIIILAGVSVFLVPRVDFNMLLLGTAGVLLVLIPYFILSELIKLFIDIEEDLEKLLKK